MPTHQISMPNTAAHRVATLAENLSPVVSTQRGTLIPPSAPGSDAVQSNPGADNARRAIHSIAERFSGSNVVDTAAEASQAIDHIENLSTFAAEVSRLAPREVEGVFQALVGLVEQLPDNELGGTVGAAALASMMQVLEANPALAAQVSPAMRATLGDLALAVDEAATGSETTFAQLLERADAMENGGRPGDVDFATFGREQTATANLQRILGDGYVVPERAERGNIVENTLEAVGDFVDNLLARLMSNPRFARLIQLISTALQQKENAFELLGNDLNEEQMAQFKQANSLAQTILDTAMKTIDDDAKSLKNSVPR